MKPWTRWAIVLGFALGGFFDGILLHQILQWHHLLSLVRGLGDLRLQVLWDGYFHALMYVVAALGLWGLWRARGDGEAREGHRLAGALLVGFGLWHILDSVLSHWVLRIHRIKLDSPNPMYWDVLWFAAFGLVPLVLGLMLLRRKHRGGMERGNSTLALLLVAGLAAVSGGWAMRPPPSQPFTTVVFHPGASPQNVFAGLAASGARLVWTTPAMGVVIVDVPAERRWELYRSGALLVTGSGPGAGCLNWSRP